MNNAIEQHASLTIDMFLVQSSKETLQYCDDEVVIM
jgi:hypothetical protein